jgi:hypothetical protein
MTMNFKFKLYYNLNYFQSFIVKGVPNNTKSINKIHKIISISKLGVTVIIFTFIIKVV